MYLTLTAQQILVLHSVLNQVKNSFNISYPDLVNDISDQVEKKILDALGIVEGANSQKMFDAWQKKETEKIHELESELNDLKLTNNLANNKHVFKKKNKF